LKENIVLQAYEMMKTIFKSHFESVMGNAAYSDFTGALVEFCKNLKFTKTGLHSVEMLKNSIPRIADFSNWKAVAQRLEEGNIPSEVKVSPDEDPNFKFWFPILFGLYEVIMTCDLEVRTRALTYLFETLKTYGSTFPRDFWEVIAKGVLFPIFDDLKLSKSEHSKFANKEDMSVWLSTTLIQALRQFVDLFTFYYETLNFLIDGLLDLLAVCLTQGIPK
jgi:brefeldin A-inhibited guanine nucleotide-exchange protein